MEVTSNELRLGNYINAKHIGSDYDIVKVNSITNHSIGWGKGNFAPSHMDIGFFQPIPLTEEILLKIKGIYKNSSIDVIHIDDVTISIYFHDCWHIVINSDDFHIEYEGFPMLHEFQNMVALTGQELEINL